MIRVFLFFFRGSFSPFFLFAPPSVSEAEPLSTTFVGEASLFGRIPTLSLSLSRTHATNVSCELARSLSARKRNPLTLMATLQAALGASRVVGSFVGGATAAPRVVAATPLGRRTPTTTTNAAAASASSSSFQRPLETRPTTPEHGGRQLEGGVAASSSRVRRRTRRGGRSTGRNDGTASASPPAPSSRRLPMPRSSSTEILCLGFAGPVRTAACETRRRPQCPAAPPQLRRRTCTARSRSRSTRSASPLSSPPCHCRQWKCMTARSHNRTCRQ